MLGPIFKFWLVSVVLGLLAFPISFTIFKKSYEKGYMFSKIVALFLVAYFSWLLGFFKFSSGTIYLVLILMTGLSAYLFMKNKDEIIKFLNDNPGIWIASELLYLFIFLAYALFRSYQPDIVGTEKFMDFAFMNSIAKADKMPPFDPWMAGDKFHISYYYFGYLMMAVMMKLTGITAGISYNLSLAFIVALSTLAMVGLLYNLTKNYFIGILAAAFLLLISNIDGFIQVAQNGWSFSNFNWWHSSRIIDYKDYDVTINEFPFFSFLLGDMHPHQMAIPFVLTALNGALVFLRFDEKKIVEKNFDKITLLVFTGLLLGGLWFLNSWDLPTYFFITALCILSYKYSISEKIDDWDWLKDAMLAIGIILGIAIVAYLPFTLFFKSQASGIDITKANTKISDYLVIFGIMLFPVISFLVFRILNWMYAVRLQSVAGKKVEERKIFCPRCSSEIRAGKLFCGTCGYKIDKTEMYLGGLELPIKKANPFTTDLLKFLVEPGIAKAKNIWKIPALVVVIVLIMFVFKTVIDKPNFGFLIAGTLLLAVVTKILGVTKVELKENQFVIILIFASFLLAFGCEFLHVRDTFGKAGGHTPLERMNTVFKFYYQIWILLSVAAAYAFFWIKHFYLKYKPMYVKWIWYSIFVVLIGMGLFYPVASAAVKTGGFNGYTTLDGTEFFNMRYPGDYQAIAWIKKNIKGTPVILEAHGPEYTEYGRISSFTGLPTVLGWPGHELQWRGTWEEPGARMGAIDKIYTTTDINEAQRLLKEYNVDYVYVGLLEKTKQEYRTAPKAAWDKFGKFMDIVYSNQAETVIYKVR
ncbi:MAG: DUF2298 domain-containing protein [bacterium]